MKFIKSSLILTGMLGTISLAEAKVIQCPQPEQIKLEGASPDKNGLASFVGNAKGFRTGMWHYYLLKNMKVSTTITTGDYPDTVSLCCNYAPKGGQGQLQSGVFCANAKETANCKVRQNPGAWPSFECKD